MRLIQPNFDRSAKSWAFIIVIMSFLFSDCGSTSKISKSSEIEGPKHVLMIDAGSSGSRIYVYKVAYQNESDLPAITMVGSESVNPGISEFENNPEEGKKNIITLLTYAKEEVEEANWKETPIYLLATAGMRLYSIDKRERIMGEIGNVINEEGSFDFMKAMTISGQYEGLYGWLTLNYLDDQFDPTMKREGLLEMGGAST